MNLMNKKYMDQMFRRVDNVVWDLSTGMIGVKNKDGIVTMELGEISEDKNELTDPQVVINVFDEFGMAIPAFAQSISPELINLGDMIYGSTDLRGWVVKKNAKSFEIMKADGTRSRWTPPKVKLLGFDSGVLVLRNLMNMFSNGTEGLAQFQGNLMPLMMLGGLDSDGGGDFADMIPMMLMMQMGGTGTATSGMQNMLPMLMMMKMMKGGSKPSGSGGFFN